MTENSPRTMTRKEAFDQDLDRYPSARPCLRGHKGERYTSTGACVDCVSYYNAKPNVAKKKLKTAERMLREGYLPKMSAVYMGSNLYCSGQTLPCGHVGQQLVIDDSCRTCLQLERGEELTKLALELLS